MFFALRIKAGNRPISTFLVYNAYEIEDLQKGQHWSYRHHGKIYHSLCLRCTPKMRHMLSGNNSSIQSLIFDGNLCMLPNWHCTSKLTYYLAADDGPLALLKASLRERDSVRVKQTENMIHELNSMAVLCNEEWLATLIEIQVNMETLICYTITSIDGPDWWAWQMFR